MSGRFKRATRERSRLRMAIDGPAGSGKTYTALEFAMKLADLMGGLTNTPSGEPRVGVIDSEHGKAALYLGEQPDPNLPPWDFLHCVLSTFSPTEYTSSIEDAWRSGCDVLIIDSLSHAWAGKDGALELKDRADTGNSYTAWKNVTPVHLRMVESILQAPGHVICTMRSKMEHVLVENEKGRLEPKRVGMAPVQRPGMEYEFDLYCSLDWTHTLSVSKSRCSAVADAVVPRPSGSFMEPIFRWLETGAAPRVDGAATILRLSRDQLAECVRLTTAAAWSPDYLQKYLAKMYAVQELQNLKPDQAADLIGRLSRQLKVMDAGAQAKREGKVAAPKTEPAKAETNEHAAPAAPTSAAPPTFASKALESCSAVPGTITEQQFGRLQELIRSLEPYGFTKDDWRRIRTKRGADQNAGQLSEKDAEDLIGKLGYKLTCAAMQTKIEGGVPADEAEASPASEEVAGTTPAEKSGEPEPATVADPTHSPTP